MLDTLPTGIATITTTVGRTITSAATGLASIASHVFPFVAHLFSVARVYLRFDHVGYKVFDFDNARTRFITVATKVYNIRKVFKRWGQE